MSIILKENDARQIIAEPLTIDDFSEGLLTTLKAEIDKTEVWEQTEPSAHWEVPHGKEFPEVTVLSSSGILVHGAVTYIREGFLTIDFISALAGRALLN